MGELRADGLDPYLVITATKVFFDEFRNPFSLFAFLEEKGIGRAHIERITPTGFAHENWERLGLSNGEYSKAMTRLLLAYDGYKRRGGALSLSPFDGILASAQSLLQGQPQGYGCWSGGCDTRFHTVDANGYKRGCTALTAEIDNKKSISAFRPGDDFASTRKERRIYNCVSCDFRPICSSGCLALSMDDGSGECSGGGQIFKTALDIARLRGKGE
jgi:radical SAM protein with 4Fe4S-binding SPASM domain